MWEIIMVLSLGMNYAKILNHQVQIGCETSQVIQEGDTRRFIRSLPLHDTQHRKASRVVN